MVKIIVEKKINCGEVGCEDCVHANRTWGYCDLFDAPIVALDPYRRARCEDCLNVEYDMNKTMIERFREWLNNHNAPQWRTEFTNNGKRVWAKSYNESIGIWEYSPAQSIEEKITDKIIIMVSLMMFLVGCVDRDICDRKVNNFYGDKDIQFVNSRENNWGGYFYIINGNRVVVCSSAHNIVDEYQPKRYRDKGGIFTKVSTKGSGVKKEKAVVPGWTNYCKEYRRNFNIGMEDLEIRKKVCPDGALCPSHEEWMMLSHINQIFDDTFCGDLPSNHFDEK